MTIPTAYSTRSSDGVKNRSREEATEKMIRNATFKLCMKILFSLHGGATATFREDRPI